MPKPVDVTWLKNVNFFVPCLSIPRRLLLYLVNLLNYDRLRHRKRYRNWWAGRMSVVGQKKRQASSWRPWRRWVGEHGDGTQMPYSNLGSVLRLCWRMMATAEEVSLVGWVLRAEAEAVSWRTICLVCWVRVLRLGRVGFGWGTEKRLGIWKERPKIGM